MNAEQVRQYIGLPYADAGFGPDRFNCWGLCDYLLRVYFKKSLPVPTLGDADANRAMHAASLAHGDYQATPTPTHGDIALLRGGDTPHVGMWLDLDGGGVLHAMVGKGVIWTPKQQLNMLGFGRAIYYRIK